MRRTHPMTAALAVALGLLSANAEPGREIARTIRFKYSVAVRGIPQGARKLSLWIPIPKTNPQQRVLSLKLKSSLTYAIAREKTYQNQLVTLSASAPLPKTVEMELDVVVTRLVCRMTPGNPSLADDQPPTPRDLAPDSLVPIDGEIAVAAARATKGARTPLEKARAIYEYVTSTMRYDKSGQGWGRGDALYACGVRRGNCTDFHSLIIGMARACKIPARFVIGFLLPADRTSGEVPGYHCWAELYVEGLGWLPVDASEANRHPERRAFFFGGLDPDRIEFSRGRDLERLSKPVTR